MSNKTYLLSLNGDTFNSFKLDFDNSLQRLLTRMDKLQRDSGSITCKIDVQLKEDAERNLDSASEGDTVPVMRPVFSHDISTEIKVKDKTTGLLAGNRKLVWDEQLHEYVMKDIDDGQTTLFDTASDNTPAQPPETPQLPESVVDVDYTVISDDKESEEEVDFLAELAEKVYFCPSYKTDYSKENVIRLPGFVKSVNGERHADGITLSDGSIIAVDGVFFLKQTVSADVLLDGLEMNNGSVAVNRDMSTSVKGCFACGDCTGRPYQIAKAIGEGNVALHSAVAYLAENKGKKE